MKTFSTRYKVYVTNTSGNCMKEFYKLDDAQNYAEKLSISVIDTDIIIVKITKENLGGYRNGGTIA